MHNYVCIRRTAPAQTINQIHHHSSKSIIINSPKCWRTRGIPHAARLEYAQSSHLGNGGNIHSSHKRRATLAASRATWYFATSPTLYDPPACDANVLPSIHSLLWRVPLVATSCPLDPRKRFTSNNNIELRQERSYCTRLSSDAAFQRCGLRGRGFCRYHPGSIPVYHPSAYNVCCTIGFTHVHTDQRLDSKFRMFSWSWCRSERVVPRRSVPR